MLSVGDPHWTLTPGHLDPNPMNQLAMWQSFSCPYFSLCPVLLTCHKTSFRKRCSFSHPVSMLERKKEGSLAPLRKLSMPDLELKGAPSQNTSRPENRKCANVSFCRLWMLVLSVFLQWKFVLSVFLQWKFVLSVFMQWKFFWFFVCFVFASNLSSTGCSCVCSLFASEEQRYSGPWRNLHVCHVCQPCSWCHGHRRSATKWQHPRLCSRDFEASVLNKLDH